MVEISEIAEDDPQQASAAPSVNAADSRSEERLSDADEIEAALGHVTRPSARLHLENLITKLRKEGGALRRVAASRAAAPPSSGEDGAPAAAGTAPAPPRAAAAVPKAAAAVPKRSPAEAPITTSRYQSFPTYMFDAGGYGGEHVRVYVPLEGIGSHDRSKIDCRFTAGGFDLIVADYGGRSYRLLNDNLEKAIDVGRTRCIVKPNKIILKLGKVKGEYGFDSWQQLTAKSKKSAAAKARDDKNPAAGIMDMMKDMYDEGDDQMKKTIGEAMQKQRMGQMGNDPMGGMDGMMGGMGGMGGM